MTVWTDNAAAFATTRETYHRQVENSVFSDYADDLAAALPWAMSRPESEAQRRADRVWHRRKVAAARARLHRRLGLSS